MAFITLEDLVGTVEVVIFPNDYERHQRNLNVDQKVYIKGRVSASEDQQAKLVCERIVPFDEIPKEIWIKFDSKDAYLARCEEHVKEICEDFYDDFIEWDVINEIDSDKIFADKFGDDNNAMTQAGIAYATDQVIDLFANGISHVHIYSMNKPEVAQKILENLSCILK